VHSRTAPLEGNMTGKFHVRTPRGRHFVPMIAQFKPPITRSEHLIACKKLVKDGYEVTDGNIITQVTATRGVRVIDVELIEARPKDKLPTLDGKIGELMLEQFSAPIDVELTTDMNGQRWISISNHDGSLIPAGVLTFGDLDQFLSNFSRFGWVGRRAWAVYSTLYRRPMAVISSIGQLSGWHSPMSM